MWTIKSYPSSDGLHDTFVVLDPHMCPVLETDSWRAVQDVIAVLEHIGVEYKDES